MNTNQLSAEQVAAHNHAVDMYTLQQTNKNGGIKAKPVILLPTFEEETDGTWVPVESNGMRPTKKDNFSFVRFAMPVVAISSNGTPEVKVLKTNVFNDDSKLELLLEAHEMRIGDCLPETVLVIEESVIPFNKKNPAQDLKVAGNSGITCTFTGLLEDGTLIETPCPIYRRVKLAPSGTKNTLIQHTNQEEISKFQQAAIAAGAKTQTAGIKTAGTRAARK